MGKRELKLLSGALAFVTLFTVLMVRSIGRVKTPGGVFRQNSTTKHTKEFYRLLLEVNQDNIYFDDPGVENCRNVTPDGITSRTGAEIFSVLDPDYHYAEQNYIMIDGSIYTLGIAFGGNGFADAVVWDYNEDGVADILFTDSWGSGIHRAEIRVFDMMTKEETLIESINSGDLLLYSGKNGTVDVYYAWHRSCLEGDEPRQCYQVEKLRGRVEKGENGPIYVSLELEAYLNDIKASVTRTRHDRLMLDCLDGSLVRHIEELGFTDVSAQLGWRFGDIKCINVYFDSGEKSLSLIIHPDVIYYSIYCNSEFDNGSIDYENLEAGDAGYYYSLIAERFG